MRLNVLIPAAVIIFSVTGCATTKGLEVSDEDARECAEVGVKAGIQRQKGAI